MRKFFCFLFGHTWKYKPFADILSSKRICTVCNKKQKRTSWEIKHNPLRTVEQWDDADKLFNSENENGGKKDDSKWRQAL